MGECEEAAETSKSQISNSYLPQFLQHPTYFRPYLMLTQLVPHIPQIPVLFVYSQQQIDTSPMLPTKPRMPSLAFTYPPNFRNPESNLNREI